MSVGEFRYTPLEVGHIRLLLLRQGPSQDHDSIEGDLYDYELNSTPPYEALSYAWGDMHHARDILLQGLKFRVGINLYNALFRLRQNGTTRILWVDAICVNENDPDEKSIQVARMLDIYTKAERVLIWLGEATQATDQALEKLIMFEATRKSQIDPKIEFSEATGREDDIILEEGFRDISSRPWFRLMWPLVNILYARAVVLYCGSKAVSSKALVRASLEWPDQPNGLSHLLHLMPRSRRDDGTAPEYQFSELLQRLRYAKATNPRDKIYALFKLLNQGKSKMRLVPDYSMSEKEFVRAVIATLCFCEQSSVPEHTYDTVDELLLNLDPIDNDILEKIFESSRALDLETLLRDGSQYIRIESSLLEAASRNKTRGYGWCKLLRAIDRNKAIFDREKTPLDRKRSTFDRKRSTFDEKKSTFPTPLQATSGLLDASAPSAITSHTPKDVSISVSHVVEILLSQATFSDLCQRGFHHKQPEPARFAHNLPRMLKIFGRQLLREAQSYSARHTALLIRRDYPRIAAQIRIRYDPSYECIESELTNSSSDSMTETGRRSRNIKLMPKLHSADTDSDPGNYQATAPRGKAAKLFSLDEMGHFITSGQAFEALLKRVQFYVESSKSHTVEPSMTVPGPTELHALSHTPIQPRSDEPASILQECSRERSSTTITDMELPNDSFWTWVYERLSRLLTRIDKPSAGLHRIQYTCVGSPQNFGGKTILLT